MTNQTYNKIREMNNETLLERTKALAAKEREITLEVLHHLREIFRRRLYATMGFSSLHDYGKRELGYSDGACQRRISAMMLLEEFPELETRIKKGDLNLSNAAQAQKLFKAEEN